MRPQVGRPCRSPTPVATAAAVAATYAKTVPANSANSGRRWRLSPPHPNARCAPLIGLAARGIGSLGQRSRSRHHRASAETGRVVAPTSGAGERGSWITAPRNAAVPGWAVDSTRWSQPWAWIVRPATTHWAVASGGGGRTRLAWVGAGQGADPLPRDGTTPSAWRGGQDVASGRQGAGHPRHTAWHAPGQQGGHAAPGVDHEDVVGWQGRSCLRESPALASRCTVVARVGASERTPQGAADCADRTNGRAHRQDDGRQGCIGSRLLVRAATIAEPRAAKADEVTGHGAEPFLPLGRPPTFLLDQRLPRVHEGLDGPSPIRQGRAGAAHGLCGPSPVGTRREDGAPTAQEPPGEPRPAHPEPTESGSDGHVGPYRTPQDSKAVDSG
jgi:hypothetical protein